MLNKVTLIGRCGRDPDVRSSQDGKAVANLAVATSESWKDKQTGERKEQTEWHRVVMFGRLAEIAGEYLKKGSLVYIEGSLRTRKWQDKDGQDRYTTEIHCSELKMLGSRSDGSPSPSPQPPRQSRNQNGGGGHTPLPTGEDNGDWDDDIPFAVPYAARRGKSGLASMAPVIL